MNPEESILSCHRELWGWLFNNPGADKGDWPEWAWNGGIYPIIANNCFLCYYVLESYGSLRCSQCLLRWPTGNCETTDHSVIVKAGLFTQWLYAGKQLDFEKRAAIAAQIRDLPVKE